MDIMLRGPLTLPLRPLIGAPVATTDGAGLRHATTDSATPAVVIMDAVGDGNHLIAAVRGLCFIGSASGLRRHPVVTLGCLPA
jgi:hypothetical protein